MSLNDLFGLLRPIPKPDQPIECWLVSAESINLGLSGDTIDYTWIGRTLVHKTTAKEYEFDGRMPRGCSLDNPWVIVLFVSNGEKWVKHYSKSEFLTLFIDVPLLPSDVFSKSYQAYLTEIKNYIDNIKNILHPK